MVDPGGVKHLEMVQAVITRLANNAFLIKGWSITVVTAILGFAIKEGPAALALAGLVPAAMFWLLDANPPKRRRDDRRERRFLRPPGRQPLSGPRQL